jgi:hypothetical protein
MGLHDEISPAEAADRLAIRELVDAYPHCADRHLSLCVTHIRTYPSTGSREMPPWVRWLRERETA